MKPRFAADYRLLFWMFVLLPLVPIVALLKPSISPWLLCVGLYFAYCVGIASHCHNHCPVFKSRRANRLYSVWLSIFYGAPAFAWIPTHNQNHHKYTNGPGDLTQTSRYARRDSLWVALTYPLASSIYQLPSLRAYLAAARHQRPREFRSMLTQIAAIFLVHGGYLALAVQLHGWRWGLVAFACGMGIPTAFASWSMMFTNYVQHVGCNADSEHDHSRNFVSPLLNWFVFDAGFHTVHHEHPGTHWSEYRALHDCRSAAISPELNQHSIFGYCWDTYVKGAFAAGRRPLSA